jgi:hypothetical protein
MTGGEIFYQTMIRHNVKQFVCNISSQLSTGIFWHSLPLGYHGPVGYPSGCILILPVFDAIHHATEFDFVMSKHQQGAGHMVEVYARVSGKLSVVVLVLSMRSRQWPMPMVVFIGIDRNQCHWKRCVS